MDFDEASQKTEEMFNQQTIDDADVTPVGDDGGEAPDDTGIAAEEPAGTETAASEDVNAPDQAPTDVQTSVPAAQPAAPDPVQMELQQLRTQNDAIMQQNAQLQSMVNELSQKNMENIVEDAAEMPVLDMGGLSFADDATLRRAQTEYAEKMAKYAEDSIMKKLQPFIDEAKAGRAQKERQAVIAAFKTVPEMADIDEMLPLMDNVISRNSILQREDIPLDDRMIMAYAMSKGINGMNTPKPQPPTVEEMMAMYNNSPDFQSAVEQQRLAAIKNSQQVPPFSASSGAVNAALNIKDKPKTLDEAAERTMRMFRE